MAARSWGGADQDARWVQEVWDRGALRKEFGVREDFEGHIGFGGGELGLGLVRVV